MELFADSILPDFGLKLSPDFKARQAEIARLKAEREKARADEAEKKKRKQEIEASLPKIGPTSSAAGLTIQQLQAIKFGDENFLFSAQYYDNRAQQQLKTNLTPSPGYGGGSERAQFYRLNQITTLFPAPGQALTGIPGSGTATPSASQPSPIAGMTAPGKIGGPAGIKPAVAGAVSAIVAGVVAVEQFFAANPPDP